MMFTRDIGIDLGTATTITCLRTKGVISREPTVVAMDRESGRLLKVGMAAQRMLGRTPGSIAALRPLRAGVISDFEMTEQLLKETVRKLTSLSLIKPRLLITVPACITEVEERAVIDAGLRAGARKVYLMESSLAAAMGAGLDISGPQGNMVVDIGGGTTEVAVVSLGDVVESESVKVAGDTFNDALIQYIRRKHNVLIGEMTAEELKKSIGCVKERPEVGYEEVKGRCLMTGLPRNVTINSDEMVEALAEPTEIILETVHMVLERTPPELVGDISENGVVLSGGGSLLYGMDRLVSERTGIPAHVVDDALSCTAYGAGRMLSRLDGMKEGMQNYARTKLLRKNADGRA